MSSTNTTTAHRHRSTAWSRIPPYLHRASVPLLVGLTVLQLHSPPETRSPLLAAVFFYMAVAGTVLEKSLSPAAIQGHAHPSTGSSTANAQNNLFTRCHPIESKLRLAISLSRATLYLFIGDAAAAQLLFLDASSSLVFTMENWVQLGLAGSMWLLGAVLWVMEPTIYWVSRWRENRVHRVREGRRASWEKTVRLEDGYILLGQEDSDVEASETS
jgi:hypothetical protein